MSEEFTLRFKAELDNKEELNRFFDQANSNSQQFSANFSKALKSLGGHISEFAGKAKSELSAFAGKELGGSLGSQARGVLQLRDAINQLAVSSGGGNEMMADLNKQIQEVSVSSNQMQSDVTAALQAFVERTGDLKTARENLALYGKVATATSSSLEDVARVGVELSTKLGIKGVGDQTKAFNLITAQSKEGAIEMRDFATKAPRMYAALASAGGGGMKGLTEAGAMAQVYAQAFGGTGTPASVATAMENTFASMAKKRGQLEAKGITFGADRFDTLFQIIRATKGDETKLREVFTQQGMRGVNILAQDFRKTGGFGTFEHFKNLSVDPTQIDRDFAARASTGLAKAKQTEIVRARFAEKYLGGIAEFGAGHLNELQLGAYGLGFAGKGLGLAGRLASGVGGRVGAAVGAATAQRVFIVNWPGGLGGGAGLPGQAGMPLLGAAGQLLGAGVAGVALGAAAGNYLDKHSTTARRFYEGEARLFGRLTGQDKALSGIEGAGVDINQVQLARRKAEREAVVRDFEMRGLSHGAALNAADQQLKAEIKNVNVIINGEEAHAETDDGTRSPKVMVKRGGGGG